MKRIFILLWIVFYLLGCQSMHMEDNAVDSNDSTKLLVGHLYSKPFPLVRIQEQNQIKNILLLGNDAINTNEILKELKDKVGTNPEGMRIEVEMAQKSIKSFNFALLSENFLETALLSEGKEERRNFKMGAFDNFKGVLISSKCYLESLSSKEAMTIECLKKDIKDGDPLLFMTNGESEKGTFLLTHASGLSLGVGIYPYLGKEIEMKAQRLDIDAIRILKVDPDKDIEVLGKSSLFNN